MLRIGFITAVCLALSPSMMAAEKGDVIDFGKGGIKRELTFDGEVWRTTSFSRSDGSERLEVVSDEFHLLFPDDRVVTLSDYKVKGELAQDGRALAITYEAKEAGTLPTAVKISYSSDEGLEMRKRIDLALPDGVAVDRMEVERFSIKIPASRGGRGQPVFAGRWFFGLEHPAGHSRHTDGNTPEADSAHFEKVGNYSFIDLEGRDKDATARPGLVRLFHFPGEKRRSMTAVAGVAPKEKADESMELVFLDYLQGIAKKPRVFLHYNNWFDPAGKNLKGDSFVNVWREFKKVIEPEGIEMQGMVPDNGWQDRRSVWQPSGGHFPEGMKDLALLGKKLRDEGTALGLWNSIDSTTNDIGWGESQGYDKAVPNGYFSQYFAHYCLADEDYLSALVKQMRALTKVGQLGYFKHDFNHLCCKGEGHNHLPTDRHGHEANVDAMIAVLAACREENPDIYQNLTNWVWFSPWWLMHGDALWMLAGDDGFNRNWPEISMRAMATTDRDAFLWRMWGNPEDRPLVPVSRLMTHGIVKNAGGQMQGPGDTLQDWADHVMMHYGRGTQMKEWYITPSAMTAEEWKVLTSIHKWSVKRFDALKNAVYVGGRPDEGKAYGFMGWNGDLGVLVARNPSAAEQVLEVPFDNTTWYRGAAGKAFQADVVYPYHERFPFAFESGKTMRVVLPGYATMAFELSERDEKLSARQFGEVKTEVAVSAHRVSGSVEMPDEAMARCELLVIGWPHLTETSVGDGVEVSRSTAGAVNTFAGYARHGMASETARVWEMAGYDLRGHRGKTVEFSLNQSEAVGSVEVWLVTDRPCDGDGAVEGAPFPVANGFRRQTTLILKETLLKVAPPEPVTTEELKGAKSAWLSGKAFGVNGGQYGVKMVFVNGKEAGALPVCGDGWTAFRIPLKEMPNVENVIEIRHPENGDSYKVTGLQLGVELFDRTAKSDASAAFTSVEDWTHREGAIFKSATESGRISLNFQTK